MERSDCTYGAILNKDVLLLLLLLLLLCGKITLYLFNMTQQCAVAGLPREANDGCFDAANANKSCVRVHWVNPPSFPSIPPHENAALCTNFPERGSHCIVTSLSANKYFEIELDRVSCTNYFM